MDAARGATAIVEAALENFGRLDILVNNAGIVHMVPFTEASVAGLMRHFEVHTLGTMLTCKAAWPAMTAADYGRILNTVTGGLFGLNLCHCTAAGQGLSDGDVLGRRVHLENSGFRSAVVSSFSTSGSLGGLAERSSLSGAWQPWLYGRSARRGHSARTSCRSRCPRRREAGMIAA